MKTNRIAKILCTAAAMLFIGVHSAAAVTIDTKQLEQAIADAKTAGFDQATAVEDAVREVAEAAYSNERNTNPDFATSIESLTKDIIVSLSSMKLEGATVPAVFAAATQGVVSSAETTELNSVELGMNGAAESVAALGGAPTEEQLTIHQCTGIPKKENQMKCVLTGMGNIPDAVEAFSQNRNRQRNRVRLTRRPPIRDIIPGSPIN